MQTAWWFMARHWALVPHTLGALHGFWHSLFLHSFSKLQSLLLRHPTRTREQFGHRYEAEGTKCDKQILTYALCVLADLAQLAIVVGCTAGDDWKITKGILVLYKMSFISTFENYDKVRRFR